MTKDFENDLKTVLILTRQVKKFLDRKTIFREFGQIIAIENKLQSLTRRAKDSCAFLISFFSLMYLLK